VIGKTLAHYKIIEKIGAGGMGEVYRASDSRLGRDVALKILPEAFVKDPERMARFQREAQVLAKLNHANIAAIYGLEKDGDTWGLALELVEGPTLADRILSGPVRVSEALTIARQIAEAIESAHESGIVHRDLKPANVKLTLQGNVKVLDFGLAKALAGEPALGGASGDSPTISPALTSPVITGALTGVNVILGTAAYMSPEQARGKPVDRRCDIWSFGVVLFEMLTGRPLFRGETVSDTLASVLKTDPDWGTLPLDVPPEIRRLLRRCLTRDPRHRLRDIGDARIAVEEVLDGREPAVTQAPGGPTARRRVVERLVWLVALLVAVGLGLTARFGGKESRGPATDWKLSIVRPEKPGGWLQVQISPDGSSVVMRDDAGLRVRRLDRFEPVLLDGTEGAADPFWSPDSRRIGFRVNKQLRTISLDTGLVTTVAELPVVRVDGAWIPGNEILFASRVVMIVPAAGGTPRQLTTKDPELGAYALQTYVEPLPDGSRFLYVELDQTPLTSAIRVGSLDSRESREILPRQEGHISSLHLQDGYLLYVRESVALAHPFDATRAELTGDPVVLFGGAKVVSLSVAGNGVLVWIPEREAAERGAVMTWLDRGGGVVESLSDLPECWSPRISPDGRLLLFLATPDEREGEFSLFVYDAARVLTRRILSTESLIGGSWSPDGARVAFTKDGRLHLTNADGTGAPERVLPNTGDDIEIPFDWSPDGRYVVFARSDEIGGDRDLWIAEVGKGEAFSYADGEGDQQYASFSPNGKWLAYRSFESGQDEVYVDSFPTPGSRIQVSSRGGGHPRWRRDGRELFFARDKKRSDLTEFYAVAVEEANGTLELGVPEFLFETRVSRWFQFYDVSADGERLVMPIVPDEATPPIHVVADWKQSLEPR